MPPGFAFKRRYLRQRDALAPLALVRVLSSSLYLHKRSPCEQFLQVSIQNAEIVFP